MTTPPRKPRILGGKENIPPSMADSAQSSTPTHPAVSRVAAHYRASIENVLLGGSAERATRLIRHEQAQVIRREFAETPAVVSVLGWRKTRTQPLIHEDLWKNGKGPTEQTAKLDHHKCGICHQAKSHPVSYLCGHSHCYVCIRLWLERRWTCPQCVKPMYRAPFRQYAEEAALACDYPEWKDDSVVEYSWSGLVFPKEPVILVPESP
ncbi:hypothetical protein R3P38DRAFT_3213594 [Favolaschia claudopus]|uniref:RING-type domain-containing protein n=1 Tax=Favolaschia claudopus TaxID=2862362 RepID=A0AAV9ZSX9_9AGAR